MELDNKDREILYQLDCNARQSNKKIAKSMKGSKSSVGYRINNLIDKKIITGFSADLDLAKFGYTLYKIYLQFQNINECTEKKIYDYLLKKTSGVWIVKCNGKYDAIFAFQAKDIIEFENTKNEIINKFSKYILNKQIVVNLRYYLYNRKWLIEDYKQTRIKVYGGLADKENFDGIDLIIMREITLNSRITILELAKKANISAPQVIYRIKKLIEKEVLVRFTTNIDLKKLGYEYCKALVYFQSYLPERKKEFIDYCSKHPNIIAIVDVIGPWDIELEFEVKNFEEYMGIMAEMRKQFPNIIRNFESVVITKESGRMYKI